MDVLRQRIRQFREAGHLPTPADYGLARDILGEGRMFDLFAAQTPRDILHSVNTARWLLQRDYEDRELLAAALLHDIGKGHQRTRDRVAWVVAQELRLDSRAGSSHSRLELRRAMKRSRDHSAIGARLLEGAGASPLVVELTLLHHGDAGANAMLRVLQEADAAS